MSFFALKTSPKRENEMLKYLNPVYFLNQTTHHTVEVGHKQNLPIIIMALLLGCLFSCKKPEDTAQPPQKTKQDSSIVLELPEPSIGDPSRFKITELSTIDHKIFKLKDNITFTHLNNITTNEVTISIKSHCIIHEKKVIIKEYNRPLTAQIPLIEILPQEVLLHQGVNAPSCGFSFKAVNRSGSAHHFELPQLPIENYRKSHSLEINQAGGTLKEPFSNVFMEDLTTYHLNKGVNNKISYLHLICDDFEIPLEVFEQEQFVPISAFAYDSLSQETTTRIQKERPVQICRILGYKKPTKAQPILTGASAFFKLMYPIKPLLVYQKPNIELYQYPDRYFEQISQYSGQTIDFKKVTKYLRKNTTDQKTILNLLYSVVIRNNRSYPVPVFIKNKEQTPINQTDLSDQKPILIRKLKGPNITSANTMYFIKERSNYSIFKTSPVQYQVQISSIQNGKTLTKNTDGEVILLNPSGELKLSVLLKTAPDMCRRDLFPLTTKLKELRWMGTLFKYPELDIFELARVETNTIPLSGNIAQKINTTSFADSPHLMIFSRENLTEHIALNREDYLWFLESDCFKGPDIDLYNKAFISFVATPKDSSEEEEFNNWSAHWEEPHTFNKKEYESRRRNTLRSFKYPD